MEEFTDRVALVTGANRGIGLEVARQLATRGFTTILGARDLQKGEDAAGPLQQGELKVIPVQLDVTDQQSINAARHLVEERFANLDVLVNNAAILYDEWQRAENANLKTVREAFETNTLGAWRMCQAFIPLLRKSRHSRIVNVSSESGSLAVMGGGTPAYSVSKTALNALTRMLADELRTSRILVNSVCPGWVATERWVAQMRRARLRKARRVSCGPRHYLTTGRLAGSSAMGNPSRGKLQNLSIIF